MMGVTAAQKAPEEMTPEVKERRNHRNPRVATYTRVMDHQHPRRPQKVPEGKELDPVKAGRVAGKEGVAKIRRARRVHREQDLAWVWDQEQAGQGPEVSDRVEAT